MAGTTFGRSGGVRRLARDLDWPGTPGMTTTTSSTLQTSAGRERWLFGPWLDLGLGCGVVYLITLPVLWVATDLTGTTEWPAFAIVAMALLVNSPHYGATLLRVYEHRDDRRKYAVFSIWITLALAVALVASTRSLWLSSLLLTAYVSWSPWHFAGQNYGLALLFLRRRGIAFDATTKRLIHGSFVLSAALTIVAIHTGHEGDVVYLPSTLSTANTPTIFYLALPTGVERALLSGLALAILACLVGAGWRLRRGATLRELAPALLIVTLQSIWYTVPVALLGLYEARSQTLVFGAIWISTAHSLQYLWVTSYYARDARSKGSVRLFLLKCFGAGVALDAVPLIVLAPHLFGAMPIDVGFAATLFAVTNLHHFILDGAVWKLRDGRVARVLLRTEEAPLRPEPIDGRDPGRWARRLVWSAVGLAVAAHGAQLVAEDVVERSQSPARIDFAVQVLRWTGHEGVGVHLGLGLRFAAAGDFARAAGHLERSIALFPTPRAWAELGGAYQAQGKLGRALDAFDAALALNPDFWGAHQRRAEVLLALDPERSPQTLDAAIASLERAVALAPERAAPARRLAELRRQRVRSQAAGTRAGPG